MATSTTVSYNARDKKVEAISAAYTVDKEDSGKVFILDAAAGATVTLPALDYGLNFKFIVGASFATTPWVIDSAEGDNINGIIADMGATVAAVPAAGEDQINFIVASLSVGDWVELVADYANSQWLVTGMCAINGGITVTDPS